MGRIRNKQPKSRDEFGGSSLELDSPIQDLMKLIKDLARKGNFDKIESLVINNKKTEIERLEKDHAMLMEGARGLVELEKLKVEEELKISQGECEKLKGEVKSLSDGKNKACEEVVGFRGRLFEVEKHREMSGRAISAMRRKQMEDDRVLKELRCKVEEDEKIIIELTRQNLRATQAVEQLKMENAEVAKAMEELQCQVATAADKLIEKTVQSVEVVNGDTYMTRIEKLRCQELNGARTIEMHGNESGQVMVERCQNQSGGDHIVKKQQCLNVDAYETSMELRGQAANAIVVSESDDEGSPVVPALNSDVSAKTMSADETIKEMRQANQTVVELSCESLEAPDTTDRMKLLNLAVETEKSESEDALKDTSQRYLEVEQTLTERRCQNSEASGVIEVLRKNIPIVNVYKRRCDQIIDEMRCTQLETAKIVEELRSKLLKVFQTIEELKHLILAADEAFEENKRWEVLPRVKMVEEGLIRVLKIKVQDLTNEVMKDAASLNLPVSEDIGKVPPVSSWMGEGGENHNAGSPHQVAETNINHGEKETVNSHDSDPTEVTDSDHEAIPAESAYNADLSPSLDVERTTCVLTSLRRSSLRDENDRNKNRRIQDSTHERDESGRIKSSGKSNLGLTAVVPVSRKRKEKAVAACDSRTQTQNVDSFSNSSSDSEDESCPEYLDGIRPSRRSRKHQKAWVSGSDMLNDFQEDIELCMNGVCVLYRQEISQSESSVGSHGEFAHFHAVGGRALAEYLIDGDPLNRLKKLLSEVKQQRPEVLVQCRKVAMDYSDKLFSIYNNGEDPFFKSRCISSSIEAAQAVPNASNSDFADGLPDSDPVAGAPNNSRYEAQKRRDWNTFRRFLLNQHPSVAVPQCNKKHVLDFLRYLDQFGKTKVHSQGCAFHGKPEQSVPCTCPLRQAWGSLDSTIGRLRAAYEDNVGSTMSNPFASMVVRNYLKQVKESQSIARGVSYKKKRKQAS